MEKDIHELLKSGACALMHFNIYILKWQTHNVHLRWKQIKMSHKYNTECFAGKSSIMINCNCDILLPFTEEVIELGGL